jgi:Cytochrome c
MTIPLIPRIGALVLATTGFYAYVGQMVPQNEVQPPPEVLIRADLTTADMVTVGRQIMDTKGLCFTCHTIGRTGALRFPDLAGVGTRAQTRVPGLSDVEYFAQTLYEPEAFIVPGFNPGMPVINRPPIGLTDQEILCVIAYLQSLGGTPTVTLQTAHRYYTPPAAPGAAPAAPGAPPAAPGAAPPPAAAPAQGVAPGAPPAASGGVPAPAAPAQGAKPGAPPVAPGVAPAPAAPAKGTP